MGKAGLQEMVCPLKYKAQNEIGQNIIEVEGAVFIPTVYILTLLYCYPLPFKNKYEKGNDILGQRPRLIYFLKVPQENNRFGI